MRENVFSILLLFSVSVFAIGGGSSSSPDWNVYTAQVAGDFATVALPREKERSESAAGENTLNYNTLTESNDDSPISAALLPYEVGWRSSNNIYMNYDQA